jgi:hypothetical protein
MAYDAIYIVLISAPRLDWTYLVKALLIAKKTLLSNTHSNSQLRYYSLSMQVSIHTSFNQCTIKCVYAII